MPQIILDLSKCLILDEWAGLVKSILPSTSYRVKFLKAAKQAECVVQRFTTCCAECTLKFLYNV